jgi:hypothetical protein
MPSKPISHPIDSLSRFGDLVKNLDGKLVMDKTAL